MLLLDKITLQIFVTFCTKSLPPPITTCKDVYTPINKRLLQPIILMSFLIDTIEISIKIILLIIHCC